MMTLGWKCRTKVQIPHVTFLISGPSYLFVGLTTVDRLYNVVFVIILQCCNVASLCFGFSFCGSVHLCYIKFSLFSNNQDIGWEEHLQNDLFCVEWGIKL